MATFTDELQSIAPCERMGYVKDNLEVLETLSEPKLTRVGTLLCHASSPESRKAAPIIGDLRMGHAAVFASEKQDEFETQVFGDADQGRRGSFSQLHEDDSKVDEND